jgi:integrase
MAARFERTERPGIYLRGATYYASVTVDGTTRKIAAGPKIGDAIRLKRKLEAERDKGHDVFGRRERELFVDYATAWIASYAGRGSHRVSERTRNECERDLGKHVFPWMARTRLGRVDRRCLTNLVAHLQSPEKGLADATVRRIMAPVKASLADAYEHGDIATNPAVAVRILSAPRPIEEQQAKALSREQLAKLIAAIDPRHRTLVRVLAATGMRINEALALQWEAVDLGPSPTVTVKRAVKWVKGRPSFGTPKSHYGHRSIPLPASVAADLRLHQAESEWPRSGDLIFCTGAGTVLADNNVRRRYFRPAAKAAGVPWAGFHSLRHTFASLLIAEGRSIVQVQRMLGHHSPSFTLSVYAHMLPGEDGGALDLDGALAQSAPSGRRVALTLEAA